MQVKTIVLLCLIGTILGCAKIYFSPDARSLAASHKIIAVVPPKVSIAPSKQIDSESLKEQQKTEAINFQKEIYSWLLQRRMQNKIFVEIQDIETTNARLVKAGASDNLAVDPSEMCEILGVDGIVTSNFALAKPMSTGGAIAVGIITGFYGATNAANATVGVFDNKTDKTIWNYSGKLSGSIGSSPSRMVDQLMRVASKNMPYVN